MTIIEARVQQKKDTEVNWLANQTLLLDGEQAFVVSDVGLPINFKIGDGTKTFSQLSYWIKYGNVPTAVDTAYSFTGKPVGVYLPKVSGTYAGLAVDLTAGITYLIWDGATLTKVVYAAMAEYRILRVDNNMHLILTTLPNGSNPAFTLVKGRLILTV